MIENLDMKSPDWANLNAQFIAERFPNCVTETSEGIKIDFDLLKQELSMDVIEGTKERYRLEWPGKKEAIVTANLPTTKTLRPIREDSVDFDNTENLYIEGDNLEVLKLLQESYLSKIKLIYIDPPYNTGKDFVYKDNFSKDAQDELFESGQKDEYNQRLFANPESSGRYHSDWLSMIYPRLKLARNLLTDDGLIIIHIDENEYSNLEKVQNEIFGEINNLGTIVWDKRNPKGEVAGVAQQHELISIYSKNKEIFKEKNQLKRPKENAGKILDKAENLIKESGKVNDVVRRNFKQWLSIQDFSGGEKAYNLIDENGFVFQTVSMAAPDKPETRSHRALLHPKNGLPCPVPEKGWRFPDKTMDILLSNSEIVFGEDESTQPRRKYLLSENLYENVPSLLYFGGSDNAMSLPFDNPKPLYIAKKLIESASTNNDIILDFFSGSATTAHATLLLNAENISKRKFILVQLPESTIENGPAYKAGFKNICEIGKERIKKATDKIKEETGAKIDYGFRVYRLDESNMQDVYYKPKDYNQSELDLFSDNIKPDRSADDLLAQVMLDWGLPLSLNIIEKTMAGKKVYRVANNSLYACFDNDIDEQFAKELAKDKPLRVVFKDSGFKDDTAKTNIKQLLKQLSPDTEMKVL